MISKEDFRKALGKKIETLSDDDIEKMRILMDKTADILFDIWNTNITESNETKSTRTTEDL